MAADDEAPSAFSVEVGARLRAVRKARRMSLDDVERESGGRWSASAIGAYERGFRNLSLPRLRELAQFYEVPMSVLLGEADTESGRGDRLDKVVLDLHALGTNGDASAVMRYLRGIIIERGDYNGRILSIRKDDVRALCAIMQVSEHELVALLSGWGALVADSLREP